MFCGCTDCVSTARGVVEAICVGCKHKAHTDHEITQHSIKLLDESDEAKRKDKASLDAKKKDKMADTERLRGAMWEGRRANEVELQKALVGGKNRSLNSQSGHGQDTAAIVAALNPKGVELLATLKVSMLDHPGFLQKYNKSQPTYGMHEFEIILREFWLLGNRVCLFDPTISTVERNGLKATCALLVGMGGFACDCEQATDATFFSRSSYFR